MCGDVFRSISYPHTFGKTLLVYLDMKPATLVYTTYVHCVVVVWVEWL